MTNQELVYKVARILAKHREYSDILYFSFNSSSAGKIEGLPDDHIRMHILCNDVFWWATSDMEEITEENVDILEQSLSDSKYAGEILFCARVRKMRPQGAFCKDLSEEDKKLFNEVGPEREIDFWNPCDENGVYGYRKPETKGEVN